MVELPPSFLSPAFITATSMSRCSLAFTENEIIQSREVENVFEGESSYELSIAREISDNPDEAATNTDDAFAALAEHVGMQVFFRDILKDPTTRIYFTLAK